jgi:hypothetical protein
VLGLTVQPISERRARRDTAGREQFSMSINPDTSQSTATAALGPLAPAVEYVIDATQRSILYWDVMRQRGNQYRAHLAKTIPHVLDFAFEPVMDGRTLQRPVNYGLVRIIPPQGVTTDPTRRPFVVVDPRAGHGPGIGGFKTDSEIGVALKAGHPCYFIGFLPDPVPGQTIEDIARAEAVFLERVIALHPEADGKPCVIGNCQAGWAVMILAAMRPDLFGPIIIAGSPMSYWTGVHGKNPMRYSGGLLGGTWLAALTSDLGRGKFDGAWLVQNFENLNPANTLWTKQYNLYSKVDTEAPRYLGFERYWGGHVNLNAEEIQFIVDELFVGNRLAAGEIKLSDGTAIDLRNIDRPIVVFCSKGDNISPPQQALGWVLDLYRDVDEIRSYGQTIVYTIHDDIGHLGIFVSAGVARKEYDKFSSNIDLIDVLPPGLYEAVFERRSDGAESSDAARGEWIMRCEERTLDDIRALGGNDIADERRFATAAKVSEINLALYRTFAQPLVRAAAPPWIGEAMHELHPLRVPYQLLSGANPLMAPVSALAQQVRENRVPAPPDNSLLQLQELGSRQITAGLDAWRDMRDAMAEWTFMTVYGSPLLQAAVGIDPADARRPRQAGTTALHRQLVDARIAELEAKVPQGGLREAFVRTILYVLMPRGGVDERGFDAIRRIRAASSDGKTLPLPELTTLTLAEFKALVREQFFMLLIDQPAAVAAIPALLPKNTAARRAAFALLRQIASANLEMTAESAGRLREAAQWYGVDPARALDEKIVVPPIVENVEYAKVS